MKRLFLSMHVVLVVILGLGGCMKMGPDYHRPDTNIQMPESYQYAPAVTVMPEPDDQWWRVFNDPELNQLVEEVLKNNLDIKRATAAVLEVRAQLV
ncbi:MAG: hypothetical protein P8X67_16055, partial [Syntrophobacterales bacterium]